MEGIRQWAFALSAAMVAAGLCRMLAPRGGMEKMFQTTASVFLLASMLSPFAIDLPALPHAREEYPQARVEERAGRLLAAATSQAEDAVRWEAAKLVGEKLSELGIKCEDVAITMEQSGQSGQSGESVSADIVLARAHEKDHREIHAALERALGFPVRIRYGERGEDA